MLPARGTKMHKLIAALALACFAASCLSTAAAPGSTAGGPFAQADRYPLGSQQNPVRVNMPPGQRAYLNRLRCSDGAAPTYQRLGNGGVGVFGSIVDIYDVRCANGEPRQSQIWMDMYHPNHREDRAVPGFSITP